MKRRMIIGLALMISGVLLGCSALRVGVTDLSQREGGLYREREVVGLGSAEATRPWKLQFASTERIVNNHEMFLTVHERVSNPDFPEFSPEYTFAAYLKLGDRFKLMKRFNAANGYFLRPKYVGWAVMKVGDGSSILQVTEVMYGSGNFVTEHFFAVTNWNDDVGLEEAEFISAAESFKSHLNEGESYYRGVHSEFVQGTLNFTFLVEKDSDAFCCASNSIVTGTYAIERKLDGKLRISMSTFLRRAPKPGEAPDSWGIFENRSPAPREEPD